MRILMIDDNKDLAEGLKAILEQEYFSVDICNDGLSGLIAAQKNNHDLILLDLMLPALNGKNICRELREQNISTPIIIMSVKSEIPSKLELFSLGADDYIVKPFSFQELVARIRSHLKRPKQFRPNIITIDDLNIDIDRHLVIRAGQEIRLTKTEFAILQLLAKKQNYTVSKHELLDLIWGENIDALTNTLEAHVVNLRKKIDRNHPNKLIHTIPGSGYKLSLQSDSTLKP